METELSVGQQKVLFDREATTELYRQTITTPGADSCTCISCKNFAAQRGKLFPESFDQFLGTLGIDPSKEWEAFDHDFGGDESGHLYGGWFLFVGELAGGPEKGIGPQSKPFDYWFTTSFPNGTSSEGREILRGGVSCSNPLGLIGSALMTRSASLASPNKLC